MSEHQVAGDFASMIERLLMLTPDTAEAEHEQRAIEHQLMSALGDGGQASGEALINSLTDHGHELVRVAPCFWRVEIPSPRVLEVWFNPPRDPFIAALSYRVGTPWGTPGQRRAAQRQEAFYARYEKLIAIEQVDLEALSPEDRLIFFVGEFEADVNNGGFGQYLDNKGADRAGKVLQYLAEIGARRTARWLASAIETAENSRELERLSSQFFSKPEDLASLVMRHLSRIRDG